MKKTLTVLTLTGIAATAIANPNPQEKKVSDNAAPIANIKLSLPTNGSGSKQLVKVDPSADKIKVSDKKSGDVDIIPLPTDEINENNINNNVNPLNNSSSSSRVVSRETESITKKETVNNKEKTKVNVDKITTIDTIKKPDYERIVKKKVESVESIVNKDSKKPDLSSEKPNLSLIQEVKEAKDVKTEITLEKKESVTNIKPVSKKPSLEKSSMDSLPFLRKNESVKLPVLEKSGSDLDKQKKETSFNESTLITPPNTIQPPINNLNSPVSPGNNTIKKEQNNKSDSKIIDKKSIKKKTVTRVNSNGISNSRPAKSHLNNVKSNTKSNTVSVTNLPLVEYQLSKPLNNQDLLKNSDIDVNVLFNPTTKQYLVKFTHKNDYNFRNSDFSNILYATDNEKGNTPIFINWTNSMLNNMHVIKSDVNDNGEYLINVPASSGACEALYVSYKLSGEKLLTTKAILLDNAGQPSSTMDRACPLPVATQKDDIQYTQNGYIVSTHWSDIISSASKPIKFTSLVSQEGVDLNPIDLRYFIFSEDFTKFYYSVGVNNTNNNSLGQRFVQSVSSTGIHYFTSVFTNDNNTAEYSTTKRYINK